MSAQKSVLSRRQQMLLYGPRYYTEIKIPELPAECYEQQTPPAIQWIACDRASHELSCRQCPTCRSHIDDTQE